VIRFHVREILKFTGGTLISNAEGPELYTGISIDSRTITPGEVFFAIRGENHDGHDFIKQAWKAGAALAVVDRHLPARSQMLAPIPFMVVDDTIKALQAFAENWRKRHAVQCIAVVGSVGKTTTKEMVASILSLEGPCLKNSGNFNNYIGLPLSVLELSDYHRFAVLEMGANMRGEIKLLTNICRPQAAILTRIGWAHLEGFGTPENLLEEKGSVLVELPASGWCVLNSDDEYFEQLSSMAPCRVITYGFGKAEVRATDISLSSTETAFVVETPLGSERIHLKAFGRHFIENALAAIAALIPLEITMEQMVSGLNAWRPASQRGGVILSRPGVYFIDESYNANPLSVDAALVNLSTLRNESMIVAVLGEMKELGEFEEEGHLLIGRRAAELGIDYLVAVGKRASTISKGAIGAGMNPSHVISCLDEDEAIKKVEPLLTRGVWVLFKGSRAARMERIMEALIVDELPAGTGGF
jgi:UDP-N-acetylmuramoyl-tripeptide--D-alanyl-D-alanine ligase